MATWKQIITEASSVNHLADATAAYDMGGQKITTLGTPSASGDAATKAYVDSVTVADTHMGSTDLTVTAGRTITLDGNSANALEIVDGSDLVMKFVTSTGSENVEINKLNVTGVLQVTGTHIITNTETIAVADNTLVLNSDKTGSADVDAGIIVERGDDGDNALFFWDEGDNRWKIGLNAEADLTTSPTYSADVMQVRLDGGYNATSDEVPIGHMQYHGGNLYVRVED
tara:strand:+ start:574 stop:1257 length:684 start_codon:yes stop_codon:yes gene_type:complete